MSRRNASVPATVATVDLSPLGVFFVPQTTYPPNKPKKEHRREVSATSSEKRKDSHWPGESHRPDLGSPGDPDQTEGGSSLLNGGESGEAALKENQPAKTRKRTLGPPG